jgi:hypothetical protein
MEIKVCGAYPFKNVSIIDGNTRIGLGLLNHEESMELARVLKSAIGDLIDDQEEYKAFLISDE